MKKNNLAKDSFILIFVQCVTMCGSLVQAMILSRTLTKFEYGTYSQGVLLVSVATAFVGLGLNNSINYFYNKTEDIEKKKIYTNTIFFLTFIFGLIGALIIILSNKLIADYFANSQLAHLIIYISFRPLFINIISLYQTLYVSNQMTKVIAIRNLMVSICQVAITTLVSLFVHNIALIFILLCILDLTQIFIFSTFYRKKVFEIKLFKFDFNIFRPILTYAVPLAAALMVGTLLINMDNLFIGKLMSTEDLALYTNMSKELPFSFIGGCLTTVITPVIIKLFNAGEKQTFFRIWSNYIQLGYLTTWTFCCGAIVCAPELLTFLYSEKYIDGINIFIIYIIVGMFRFTYFGMILTAKGRTKIILFYSLITMLLNLFLNIILFHFMGMIGSAIGTLISMATMNILQLIHGSVIAGVSFFKIINIRGMIIFLMKLVITGIICKFIKNGLYSVLVNSTCILVITYVTFVLILLGLNFKKLNIIVKQLNIEI
ncbi:oligosaccharide flippase family protein [Caproiciproducens sp. CPB-2]|uniref:oligosaccharide flippase family protein n=1 Tax=Caproiciproducens sp. CPB-2 TaxID=3030017 RepID=UPI0023DC3BE0|nr:oligosaccharide flippase family protein [Caproiciproducens sp. CPB-2]MDF1494092.1 oligosaccharide flippase family protein [Caproiciproducens sp. CPB-2]